MASAHIFISHSRQDDAFVKVLRLALDARRQVSPPQLVWVGCEKSLSDCGKSRTETTICESCFRGKPYGETIRLPLNALPATTSAG